MAHNKKANETSKRDQIPLTKSSQHEQLTQKLTRSLAFSIGVKINGPIEARSLEVTVSKYRMIKTSVSQPNLVGSAMKATVGPIEKKGFKFDS